MGTDINIALQGTGLSVQIEIDGVIVAQIGCGDQKININDGEQCDDGNSINNDGCSNICTIEKGWKCDNVTNLNDSSFIYSECTKLTEEDLEIAHPMGFTSSMDTIMFVFIGIGILVLLAPICRKMYKQRRERERAGKISRRKERVKGAAYLAPPNLKDKQQQAAFGAKGVLLDLESTMENISRPNMAPTRSSSSSSLEKRPRRKKTSPQKLKRDLVMLKTEKDDLLHQAKVAEAEDVGTILLQIRNNAAKIKEAEQLFSATMQENLVILKSERDELLHQAKTVDDEHVMNIILQVRKKNAEIKEAERLLLSSPVKPSMTSNPMLSTKLDRLYKEKKSLLERAACIEDEDMPSVMGAIKAKEKEIRKLEMAMHHN
jgi:cysteine-rich repeat protein